MTKKGARRFIERSQWKRAAGNFSPSEKRRYFQALRILDDVRFKKFDKVVK